VNLPEFLVEDKFREIRLKGHRIGLYTVVREYKEGRSAEQIAEQYPSLPLDLVRKTIAFALENRAEVDAYYEEYKAELERQAAAPPGPGVLRIRRLAELLQEADARHASDPEWARLGLAEKVRRIEAAEKP
jgi:uncharacterized protein (DUF433 family)